MGQAYPDPTDAGLIATVAHAARCHAKAEALRRQSREAMAVAASMASGASIEAITDALAAAREAAVPGIQPLSTALRDRTEELTTAPGTARVRRRSSSDPWPRRGIHVVYVLWGADGPLYIGKSSVLRSRIGHHRSKPWTEAHLHFCADEPSARQLEADLIFQHQPPLNVAGRHRRLHVA